MNQRYSCMVSIEANAKIREGKVFTFIVDAHSYDEALGRIYRAVMHIQREFGAPKANFTVVKDDQVPTFNSYEDVITNIVPSISTAPSEKTYV